VRSHWPAIGVLGAALVIGCTSGDDESSATTERPAREAPAAGGDGSRRTETESRQPLRAARGVRLLRLGRFANPTYLTAPPGDRKRRFVVERAGRIVVLRGGRKRTFLDIGGRVQTGGESGMLSMAFAPDYARSRRFYVYYTDNRGFPTIQEFRRSRRSADRALPSSGRIVMSVPHSRFNHKGGQLQFGPDGRLYAGFGDGGGGGDPDRNGQDLGELLGKLIRIDPRPSGGRPYRIPADNPFRGRSGARPEVYAYGLRNPWRFSFDRRKGHLTVGDVGQNAVEEIDFVPNRRGRGRVPRGGYNFGWNVFEGRSRYSGGSAPGHVPPVTQRTHDQGACSITGGYVIRDRALGRGIYGRYVYGDLCDGRLRVAALRRGRARADRALGPSVSQLVSFGEDSIGRVYAVSLGGAVYRIAAR
jgi:glucose/arabinose dehydrogenase